MYFGVKTISSGLKDTKVKQCKQKKLANKNSLPKVSNSGIAVKTASLEP